MILTMIRLMLLKWISRLEYYKLPQYCGLKDRRQFLGFLFTSFAELLFIPGNLLGLNDYLQPHTFDVLNYIQLVFFVVLQLAFWRNWISITTALYILFIEVVMKISVESLWQAYMGGAKSCIRQFQHYSDDSGGRFGGAAIPARPDTRDDTHLRFGSVLPFL